MFEYFSLDSTVLLLHSSETAQELRGLYDISGQTNVLEAAELRRVGLQTEAASAAADRRLSLEGSSPIWQL